MSTVPGRTALNSSPPSRPTWPWSPIAGFSRCATCAQQGVANRMAERIVDVLEPVEIDQEQRAALLAMCALRSASSSVCRIIARFGKWSAN